MPKPNMLRSHLYRLLVCLSVITLLTGQAAAPADDPTPTPTATPPTPAQEAWVDWTARSAPEPSSELVENQSAPEQAQYDRPCSPDPQKANYINIVYSMISEATGWDEEIFLQPKLCSDVGDYGKRLTTSPGADFEPRLSKDGASIVFVSDRNSTSANTITNIYTMSSSGTGLQRITSTQAQDRMPAFSPDGKKIVFVSTRDGSGDIYTMNLDGTQQKRLTTAPEPDVEPDWSPDGKSIVWVRRFANGTGVLYLMNPDGTQQRPITKPLPYLNRPMWSPSGAYLLFNLDFNGDGWYDVARLKSDGTNLWVVPLPLDPGAAVDYVLGSWLPDESGFFVIRLAYWFDSYNGKWWLKEYDSHYIDFKEPANLYNFNYIPYYLEVYFFTPHAVSLDDIPPVSKIAPMPEFMHYRTVPVIWSATDAGSKIFSISVQSSTANNPTWQNFDYRSDYPTVPFIQGYSVYYGTPGETVYFRTQAQDRAANNEPLATKPEAIVHLYELRAWMRVTDARRQPLSGAQAALTPQAMNQPLTGLDGTALVYIPKGGSYTAQLSKPGYADQPAQAWKMDVDRSFTAVLTGPDEQIANGHFTAQSALEGWQASGSYVTSTTGRNGGSAAVLGKTSSDLLSLLEATPLADTSILPQATVLDTQGRMHIVYNDTQYGILDEQGAIEALMLLPEKPSPMAIQLDASDQPYYFANAKLIRWNGSEWQITPIPLPAGVNAQFALDGIDRLHVIYSDPAAKNIMYQRQGDGGGWQPPISVSYFNPTFPAPFAMTAGPDGTAYLAVLDGSYITFIRIQADGVTDKHSRGFYGRADTASYHYVPGLGAYLVMGSADGYKVFLPSDEPGLLPGGSGRFVGLQYDAAGNIFCLSRRANDRGGFADMKLMKLLPTGQNTVLTSPYEVSGSLFEVSAAGYPRMIYAVNENGMVRFDYRREVYTKEITENVAEQPITLDAGMHAPTLSFFFRITSPNTVSKSRLEATFTPQSGDPVTLFSRLGRTTGWQHAWVDLTPYQGQTGTLAFRVVQEAGEMPIFAAIDEVSVASLPTPVLESVTPSPAEYPIPAGAWIDLNGQNLWNGAVVSIDGTQVTQVEYIDETHIRFLAPEALSLGTHLVKVANPGGGESWITLYVGTPVFVPMIGR